MFRDSKPWWSFVISVTFVPIVRHAAMWCRLRGRLLRGLFRLAIAGGSSRIFEFSNAFVDISNLIIKAENLLHEWIKKGTTLSGMREESYSFWMGRVRWLFKSDIGLDGELWMVDGEMENMTLLYKIKQLVRMILRCIFSVVELLSTKLVMTFDNLGCKILSKPRRRISIGLLVKLSQWAWTLVRDRWVPTGLNKCWNFSVYLSKLLLQLAMFMALICWQMTVT